MNKKLSIKILNQTCLNCFILTVIFFYTDVFSQKSEKENSSECIDCKTYEINSSSGKKEIGIPEDKNFQNSQSHDRFKIEITLHQPPPNQLSARHLWKMTLINTSDESIDFKLEGTGSEQTVGPIVHGTTPLLTIGARERKDYQYEDFKNGDVGWDNAEYESFITRTGTVPGGVYKTCVVAKNLQGQIVGGIKCITQTIVRNEPGNQILLLTPADEETLTTGNNLVFTWQPVIAQNTSVTYKLKIAEILGNESPEAAVTSNRPAFYEKDGLTISNYNYPASAPQFVPEKNYAWQVYATYNNQTISSINVWKFKLSTAVSNEEECNECPSTVEDAPAITNQTASSKSSADLVNFTVKVGLFKMKILTATGSAGSLSGTGSVLIKWLKTPIAVKFENIKINTDDVVFDGIILTEQDDTPEQFPVQWLLNGVGSLNWTKGQVKKLDQWIHNTGGLNKLVKDFNLQQQVSDHTDSPLKVPIGLNNYEGYTIAITEMKFEPTKANLNCVAAFPLNFEQINDTVGLKAGNITFSPCGPSVQTGKLGLLDDVTFTGNISNGDTYNIVIKKEHSGSDGTNITWNCNGFDELNLDMDVVFPRTWLKPLPDNNGKVTANIKTNIRNWNDWIFQCSLSKCIIAGTNGMGLEVTSMTYDHSDIRNPAGISFPANYPANAETGPGFQGFYMNQGKIIFPDNFRTFSNTTQNINTTINNLIINKFGLTCKVKVENLLNFPDGNISGLGASIDTLNFDLVCSSLTSAYIRGKILLPVSEGSASDKSNALLYKANFATNNGFQFTIQPSGPIKAKFFSDGKLILNNTSCLNLTINQGTILDVKLNGDFEYGNIDIGFVKNVSMQMAFQNLGLTYTSVNNTMTFNAGQWSFASPQKFLANLPVSIKDIKFKTKSKQGSEIVRAALSFSIDVSLMQDKISGKSGLSVIGAIERNATTGKFTPKYVNVEIDNISVKANLSAVKLDGTVIFFHEDPKFGNGFDGTIKATFNSIQLAVDASLKMGSTNYIPPGTVTTGNYYRYLYVDAKVILPKTAGIPFLSGVAFYGFGAAVWKGMQVGVIPKPDVSQVENSTQTSGATSSGATFIPDKNIGLGFKVTAVVGTYPDPKTFNCDASLSAEFTTSGGLNKIGFGLDFWSMAELTKRSEASVFGNATIEYVPPDKHFSLIANATIKKEPVITTVGVGNTNDKVRLTFDIDGKTSKWYFICGTPTRINKPGTNKVKVFGITAWEYLMFGNDIAQFVTNDFEQSTKNGLNSVGASISPKQTEVPSESATGKGFAFGVGVNFNQDKSYQLGSFGGRDLTLRYGAGGGFEVNLSLLQYPLTSSCGGFNPVGFRGWYARGGVAAWVRGYANVHIPRKNGACLVCCKIYGAPSEGCVKTIADIRAGIWIQGGFPNPTWAEGSASVSVNICDLIEWSGNVDISYGSRCSIQPVVDNQSYTQEDATQQIRDMIISVEPENNSTQRFDPGTKIKTMYGFTPNDAFGIQERQANGTIINKTFQVKYFASIEDLGPAPMPVINSGSSGPMNMQLSGSNFNNLSTVGSLQVLNNNAGINLVRSTTVNQNGQFQYWISGNGLSFPYRYFQDTTKYKLTVKAELWALNSNTGVWEKAKSRTGNEIKETKIVTFNTGKLQSQSVNQTGNQPGNLQGNQPGNLQGDQPVTPPGGQIVNPPGH